MNQNQQAGVWSAQTSTQFGTNGVRSCVGTNSRQNQSENYTGNGYGAYYPQGCTQASEHVVARSTGSFVQMNLEVMNSSIDQWAAQEETTNGVARILRPHTDPVGQTTPIGDMVLPMLVCAVGYTIAKWAQRRLAKHTAKQNH